MAPIRRDVSFSSRDEMAWRQTLETGGFVTGYLGDPRRISFSSFSWPCDSKGL